MIIEDDDVPLSERLSRMSNLGTHSSNCDIPIKKRPFGNKNLLNNSVKKSKVTLSDNQDKDDTPLSRKTEMLVNKFESRLFSSSKKEHELAKKLFNECKRKRPEEENISESKEVENMIKKMNCVEGIKDSLKKMEGKIGECAKEFVVNEARLFFKNLIREHKQYTTEHKTKERVLDAMKKQFDGEVETLESKEKLYKEQVDALRLKEEMCTKREMDIELKDKLVESRKKDLDLKEKQVEIREMDVELKKNQLEIWEKEIESKKKQLEEQFMELHSKEEKFKAQMQKVKSFVSQMEDFKS